MVTQFRNQDPFKPLDSSQFLGQLAQFSTVSGIADMQSSLSSLVSSFQTDRMLSGSTLVGHDVLVPATSGVLGTEGTVHGAVDVPEGVQQVVVNVKDASGQLVRRFTAPATPGTMDFEWDGTLESGARAPAGAYHIEALGTSGTTSESLDVLIADRVNSVTLDTKTQSLVLNTATQGTVSLATVRRIS
jgi:flagellar basal-body rod modification protein FlgD